MNPTSRPSSFRSRLVALPTVFCLISSSVIFGYASDTLWPDAHPNDRNAGAHLQTIRADSSGNSDSDSVKVVDETSQTNDPLANYEATLDLLKQNYYGAPITSNKTRQLTYEAIRGMLGSLRDQFTSYLDPDEWTDMEAMTEGDFDGIGAILEQDGPDVRIEQPIENNPAERAGIKAGDVILSVDGKSIKGKTIEDAVRLIKGPRNTRVRLGVLRGKKTLEFVITRALIETPVVKHWMEDGDAKIGHIELSEFNKKSVQQMNAAFADLERQGMKALIFDLRDNPGGLLETAVDVASMFIPQNTRPELDNNVVIIHYGSGKEEGMPLRPLEHTHKQLPLVLLVNGNSASASEIVTGAIKDYGVGTIVGERTFGKGKVQTLFEMPQGRDGALRLTTALYYPPSHHDINFERDEDGNRIEGTGGILPDVPVRGWPERKEGDFSDKAHDNQLHAAVAFLKARLAKKSVAEATQIAQKAGELSPTLIEAHRPVRARTVLK